MRLARLMLLMGCGGFLFLCTALAGVGVWIAPQFLVVLFVAAVLFRKRIWKGTGWAFGTARWADKRKLAEAGMLENPQGLPLGTVDPPGIREAARYLQKAPSRRAESACRLFLKALDRKPVRVSAGDWTHAVAFAPPGKGKTSALIIPFLLQCGDSCIVIDIKGELYKATHKARRRMGHKLVVLDPYGVSGAKSDSFNVLDTIKHDSHYALDDCRAIAEALVVRSEGDARDPHWPESAEQNIAGITSMVASCTAPEARDLQTVARVLSNPGLRAKAIKTMQESLAYGGLLSRFGDQLTHYDGKELGSVLTTTGRYLRFLSTPAIVQNTTTSTFDPAGLAKGKMSIYLCIPPDRLATQNGLLRLWVTAFLRSVTRSGLKQGQKIRFVLDEAAALGHLDAVENAIAQLRGYGLSCLFMYQSMGQLEKCFPKGQAQTFMSNMDLSLYFGTNDYPTAEAVSNRLGDSTIQNWSENGSKNRSFSRDPQGMESSSVSYNSGWNVQEGARKLLQASEVLQLSERQAVIFAPHVPPLLTYLPRYYEKQRHPSRFKVAIRSFLIGMLGISIPTTACWVVLEHQQKVHAAKPQQAPAYQQTTYQYPAYSR